MTSKELKKFQELDVLKKAQELINLREDIKELIKSYCKDYFTSNYLSYQLSWLFFRILSNEDYDMLSRTIDYYVNPEDKFSYECDFTDFLKYEWHQKEAVKIFLKKLDDKYEKAINDGVHIYQEYFENNYNMEGDFIEDGVVFLEELLDVLQTMKEEDYPVEEPAEV